MKKDLRYMVPSSIAPKGTKLNNGTLFERTAIGQYYASSLEMHMDMVPQFHNGKDVLAPCDREVEAVFRPKYPSGTFGALIQDFDDTEYRVSSPIEVIEVLTVDDIKEIAEDLDVRLGSNAFEFLEDLVYTCQDGTEITYAQALEYMRKYQDHNDEVQSEINAYLADQGLDKKVVNKNGKLSRPSYSEFQLRHIANLAAKKKTITGLVMKVTIYGKHTITTDGGFVVDNRSAEEAEKMLKTVDYRELDTHLRGKIRRTTLIVPIQTRAHLDKVKQLVMKERHFFSSNRLQDLHGSNSTFVCERDLYDPLDE